MMKYKTFREIFTVKIHLTVGQMNQVPPFFVFLFPGTDTCQYLQDT